MDLYVDVYQAVTKWLGAYVLWALAETPAALITQNSLVTSSIKFYANYLIDKFYFNAKYICSFRAYGEMSFIKKIIKEVKDVAYKVDM